MASAFSSSLQALGSNPDETESYYFSRTYCFDLAAVSTVGNTLKGKKYLYVAMLPG